MLRRHGTLLGLFMSVIVMGAYLFLWERHLPSTDEVRERARRVAEQRDEPPPPPVPAPPGDRLAPLRHEQVRRFRLAHEGTVTEVVRQEGGTFTVNGQPADPAEVNDYLESLSHLRRLPVPQEEKLAPGEGRLEVETDAGTFLLAPEAPELLRGGPLRFRSRQLLSYPLDQAKSLVAQRQDGLIERVERQSTQGPLAEGFRLTQPVSAPVDVDLMTRLLTTLANLRAQRLVPEAVRPQVRFMLGSALIEAGAPARDGTCLVHARQGGDFGPTGVLPAELCRDFRPLLGRSSLLLVDDARVRQVTLNGKQRTDLLSQLHRLDHAEVIGYGEGRAAQPLLTIAVEQGPPPSGTTALLSSTVPPTRQVLRLYTHGRALLEGRPILYRVPEVTWRALTRSKE